MAVYQQERQLLFLTSKAAAGSMDAVAIDLREHVGATLILEGGRLESGAATGNCEVHLSLLACHGKRRLPDQTIYGRHAADRWVLGAASAATPLSISAAVAAGAKSIQVSALTGFAAGDEILITNHTTATSVALVEWNRVWRTQTVGSDHFLHLVNPLQNGWAAGGNSRVCNQADRFPWSILSGRHLYEISVTNNSDKTIAVQASILLHTNE